MFDEARVMAALMGGDSLFGDIFAEEKTYTHIQLESEKIEKLERGVDKGVGIRLIDLWKTFYAATNSFEEMRLIELASELKHFSSEKKSKSAQSGRHIIAEYPFTIAVDPENVGMEKKIAIIKGLEKMVRKLEPRIRQARVIYRDTKQNIKLFTSEGTRIEDNRMQAVVNLLVVGEENGEVQTAYEAIGGFYGFEFFTDEIIETLARKTVKRLSGLLSAVEAPMGTKTVVLASEAGGTMIHEAMGHGLEADLAMEGLSCYKGTLGEKMVSGLISVVDDKTLPHMRGTYAYDDEGVPSERTVLVENGVLKNYLFDRFHAMKYEMKSTGNGRRESFRFKPIPRMSNTTILPGKDNPADIIVSVDDGVYVVKMGGGQVDTVRGDFVFEISEGYRIEKGTVGPMVKNTTMMGNGLKVLQGIDMVGNDLGFGIGTCKKDGQSVPVSDAQPTLRIPEIIIGGKE